LSRIAVQHVDDGYSRRGNFGGSLVFNVFARWHKEMIQEVDSLKEKVGVRG